jgi:hypothetical protein
MAQRDRDLTGLGVALAAHTLALAWLATRDLPRAPSPPEAPPFLETSLDLVGEPAPEPASSVASRGEARPLVVTNAPRTHFREAARSSPPHGEAEIPGPERSAPPSTPPDSARALATLSADALGIGVRNPFIASLPESPTAAHTGEPPVDNVAPGVQQALRDGVRARDHDIGLDLGGPVVAIAEELTRPSSTPLNSHARFEVTADSTGKVTAVTLADASEGWGDWDKLGAALARALQARPLRVPAGARGLALTLEVTSRVQLPSGLDPGVDVSILNIPLKKAPPDQKRPRRVEVLNIAPKIEEVPPDPSRTSPVKLPQYRVQLVKILGLAFDPVDIGAPAQRVVHARVVKESTL